MNRAKRRVMIRAHGNCRVVIEDLGGAHPTFVVIVGGGAPPRGVWLSDRALRKLVETGRQLLKRRRVP